MKGVIGYTSKIISTIVDDMGSEFTLDGYTSKIISTIVDSYPAVRINREGYTSKIISTIVDHFIALELRIQVILLK